jgi:hypothetical protein
MREDVFSRKRWPRFKPPVWIKMWPKGHYGPSDALFWNGEVFLLKSGSDDTVEIVPERYGGVIDALLVESHNPRMGYRGAERFVPGEGNVVEAWVFRTRKGLPFMEDDLIEVRESTHNVFFDGEDYDEVAEMGTEEFLEHADEYWY